MGNKSVSFLAIDLGATSGRAMLGNVESGKLELQEINRFKNSIIDIHGRLYWDLFHLYSQILKSLKIAKNEGIEPASIGIDTWGVDFVCFGKDGEPLKMPYSYRDTHTFGAPEKFFEKISRQEVYRKTGIQIMNFNTLFQLDTQLREQNPIYPCIDKILFMPDALSYLLTGKMVTEYTIASTSQLVDPYARKFDADLLSAIQLNENHFAPIVFSGTPIGTLSKEVQSQTGCGDIQVVAVAGHDTASAVLATPAENNKFAYLSSGTWSLMGIESDQPVINDTTFALNFTNEGGADGSVRLLKNICGMWLIEQCKKEWDNNDEISYQDIVNVAKQAQPFRCFIYPDAPIFASPDSMIDAIRQFCTETGQFIPQTMGEIARCIYESLAFRYKQVLNDLQKLASFPIEVLHIIGGGSQNDMLNAYTANAIGKKVIAGPSEATAIGNILVQAQTAGLVNNKQEMRNMVAQSFDLKTFLPEDIQNWDSHYAEYLQATRNF